MAVFRINRPKLQKSRSVALAWLRSSRSVEYCMPFHAMPPCKLQIAIQHVPMKHWNLAAPNRTVLLAPLHRH
ncbi:hypothetical protein BST61_g6245 [Cercospora zeina]